MKCQNCGQEIGEAAQCGFCGYMVQDMSVREMSRAEANSYQGMTIDEAGSQDEQEDMFYRKTSSGGPRIFVRGIQLGHSGSWLEKLMQNYWLSRLAIGLVVATVAVVLVFVALPIVLMVTAIGFVIWMMLRFLYRG